MNHILRSVLMGLMGAACVATASSVLAQAGGEWPHYGGDQANTRYSTLEQITTGNVKSLRVVWMHSLGSIESQDGLGSRDLDVTWRV